jgi:hypothetical protein
MNSVTKCAARYRDLREALSMIQIERREIYGSMIIIFFDKDG